jgi:hypothetical protein
MNPAGAETTKPSRNKGNWAGDQRGVELGGSSNMGCGNWVEQNEGGDTGLADCDGGLAAAVHLKDKCAQTLERRFIIANFRVRQQKPFQLFVASHSAVFHLWLIVVLHEAPMASDSDLEAGLIESDSGFGR